MTTRRPPPPPFAGPPPSSSSASSSSAVYVDAGEDDDGCPLCMEAFDATDREFTPCRCGYKICLWCWHNLNNIYTNTSNPAASSSSSSSSAPSSALSSASAERPPLAGRCPACRQPYVYPDRLFNADTLQSSLSNKAKKKSDKGGAVHSAPRKAAKELDHKAFQQQQMRVLQRNLMYVLNLPAALAKEELLAERRHFGKFGKLLKVSVTRKAASSSSSSSSSKSSSSSFSSSSSSASAGGATYSAYVTFKRPLTVRWPSRCATTLRWVGT